ncbi:3'-nucleotidase/nuclease [Lotmaria passim]
MAAFSTLLRALGVTLLMLVAAAALPVHAWWAKGHMAIAEVARRNLRADVLEKVEACATMLNKLGPFPNTTTMVEMGPWADDIRSMGLNTMFTWHFIDTPFNPDNIAITITENGTKMTFNPVENVNVQTVIPMLVSAVKAAGATSDVIVTSVANLIHFVGDIHMPLHSADLFSTTYPSGDNGGNKQTVVVDAAGTSMKLHAFWDSMGEGPHAEPARPLSATAYAELQAFVDDLVAENAFTEAEMMTMDSSVMAAESYDLAVQNVYPGIGSRTVLTQAYKNQAQVLCRQRVTLAGYRLATILNSALSGVSLSTIKKSVQQIQDGVEVTHTGDTYNYYAFHGVERGAAAGIFLSCFAIGCLVATAVAYVVFSMHQVHRNVKQQAPEAVPDNNDPNNNDPSNNAIDVNA